MVSRRQLRPNQKSRGSRNYIICYALISVISLGTPSSGSWVDPDTPEKFQATRALSDGDDREFKLVRCFFCGNAHLTFLWTMTKWDLTFNIRILHRFSLMSLSKTIELFTTGTIQDGPPSTRMIVSVTLYDTRALVVLRPFPTLTKFLINTRIFEWTSRHKCRSSLLQPRQC